MHKHTAVIVVALFVLANCTLPMKKNDVENVQADCSNVDSQVAMLEKEKKDNNKRFRAGVTAVVPVGAVMHIVRGNYKTNAQIATGAWGKAVDAKLKELYAIKEYCDQQYEQPMTNSNAD